MQTAEHLVNIHLMIFKKIHVVINAQFMVFKHDIFLCFQFICCAFWFEKWEYEYLCKEDVKNKESGLVS